MSYEVEQPIINSPYEEPLRHWFIRPGETPELMERERRPALVFEPPGEGRRWDITETDPALRRLKEYENAWELWLVNLIRDRVKEWRRQSYPGVTRTTRELLDHWKGVDRDFRLFFAQREAVETIIFLTEARADLKQGISIPRDDPSLDRQAEGHAGFTRYACKMATGAGKTTVMAMLSAWSILNKVADRSDGRFSDVVLVICPNLTIKSRLQELDPKLGDASTYATRDLVPKHLRASLAQGRVIIANWHIFQPQAPNVGGDTARVVKTGVPKTHRHMIHIGPRTTTAHGYRYVTSDDYSLRVASGIYDVIQEHRDPQTGALQRALVESTEFVESDTALLQRVLGREVGGKRNILVLNDEAHHAYRIPPAADTGEEIEEEDERDVEEWDQEEATVWIDGLDKVHKTRGINFCVDLSATPYYLSRVGAMTTRPFPWIVSEFGLTDAIESGLVKIPQLAVRDSSGDEIPGFRNVWEWVLERLTNRERGGARAQPRPEAVLREAALPLQMLGGLWAQLREEWHQRKVDTRPPVFILVVKNVRIAKVVYEWLAEDRCPDPAIPAIGIPGFRNEGGKQTTIRVDTKVVRETDTEGAKNDEDRWMRFTLDTVGKTYWPWDSMGRPIQPEGFLELAKKLERPSEYPPGRDVRCIVSVGMLTEGWDCNTVTHVIGLRPFQSQLLCEQVVGRALRRSSYEVGDDGLMQGEVAQIFGVPFDIVPFKASDQPAPPQSPRVHVHALAERSFLEIKFPRVEGFTRAIRNRIAVDWTHIPELVLDRAEYPNQVDLGAFVLDASGQLVPTMSGARATLERFRQGKRLQGLAFDLARALTEQLADRAGIAVPKQALFPQLLKAAERYLKEKVKSPPGSEKIDVYIPTYFARAFHVLRDHIRPDQSEGEAPEIPVYEGSREPGSTADVDLWTRRPVSLTKRSHVNYVIADSTWEAAAVPTIDDHPLVESFVKNAGLGFTIPYQLMGEDHEYIPDFIIRLKGEPARCLILEIKGHDEIQEYKVAAAARWVEAVNAEGSWGRWYYGLVNNVNAVDAVIRAAHAAAGGPPFVISQERAA